MGGSPKVNKQKKNDLCENSVEVRSNDGIYKNSEVISGERFYFTNLQSWIQKGKLMQIRIHNTRLIA